MRYFNSDDQMHDNQEKEDSVSQELLEDDFDIEKSLEELPI